jgi:Flp pilus assembly protein TadG
MKIRIRFSELGQDLMEYAIIFPILFLILVGIFDLGRVVYYYSALTNAAREGARWGVVHPADNPNISAIISNYAVGLDLGCPNSNPPPAPEPAVTVTLLDQDAVPGNDHIQVTVCSQFKPVTPVIGFFLGLGSTDVINLHGQSTMRIES